MIKEDHLLRKRVRQYYAIKAVCLHRSEGTLDDHIEFATIQQQINDKEPNEQVYFFFCLKIILL